MKWPDAIKQELSRLLATKMSLGQIAHNLSVTFKIPITREQVRSAARSKKCKPWYRERVAAIEIPRGPSPHWTTQFVQKWSERDKPPCPPPPVYDTPTIRAPSKAELMAGRASASRPIVGNDDQ